MQKLAGWAVVEMASRVSANLERMRRWKEQEEAAKAEKELQECTFSPAINSRSKSARRRAVRRLAGGLCVGDTVTSCPPVASALCLRARGWRRLEHCSTTMIIVLLLAGLNGGAPRACVSHALAAAVVVTTFQRWSEGVRCHCPHRHIRWHVTRPIDALQRPCVCGMVLRVPLQPSSEADVKRGDGDDASPLRYLANQYSEMYGDSAGSGRDGAAPAALPSPAAGALPPSIAARSSAAAAAAAVASGRKGASPVARPGGANGNKFYTPSAAVQRARASYAKTGEGSYSTSATGGARLTPRSTPSASTPSSRAGRPAGNCQFRLELKPCLRLCMSVCEPVSVPASVCVRCVLFVRPSSYAYRYLCMAFQCWLCATCVSFPVALACKLLVKQP